MGLASGRIVSSNNITKIIEQRKDVQIGVVYDIILDNTHPYLEKEEFDSGYIGAVLYRTIDNLVLSEKELPIAFPSDISYKSLPIRNEVVEIKTSSDGSRTYRRISFDVNPMISAIDTAINTSFKPVSDETSNLNEYKTVTSTGILNSSIQNSDNTIGYGEYYTPLENIHKLKLYEGDTLIESRFGQSIRLSGYNNPSNKFSPTLIIRNSENSISRAAESNDAVEEDIARDGSVIVLSSDQYQLPFQPGTVDDGGNSDFETIPESFEGYPTKLIGDQILMNSGRIILSARNAEMIFFSKKNYGFISDGGMSIDNRLGINVTVGDNINVMTKGRDVVFYTDNGSIFLGNKDPEPIVKGQQLVNILSELIDEIASMKFLTPSGPTAEGPINTPSFGNIKSKLNNILSKFNQTS
jgi:hypothetical protein